MADPRPGSSSAVPEPRGALTRRQLLQAASVIGAGAAIAKPAIARAAARSTSAEAIAHAASVKPRGSDLGAIEHVVFLMQENRSFDHYFGTYPAVRGFDDRPKHGYGVFAQPFKHNKTSTPKGVLLPFHMDTSKSNGECPTDLSHAWAAQHNCWNNGKMDRFVHVHTAIEGLTNGVHTMGYYKRADIPYYYGLADAFTLCDHYHASVMGPTHPNRLMSMSATIDPAGRHGGPILDTDDHDYRLWSVDWETMPERLESHNVSWKVYSAPGASPAYDGFVGMALGDPVLPYFKQYKRPGTALYDKAFLPIYPADFIADVLTDSLPSVSWIVSQLGFDEHPPAPASLGEFFTSTVLNALTANPKVWAKTVLFVMYDENDGFFDHVAPPVPPRSATHEWLTVDPLPWQARGIDGPIGLGFRVPMLVLSPFSTGGHIASEVFDHTSQLRFIESRWGVEVPNLTKWRRKTTGDLTSTLHMGHSNKTVPKLPQTSAKVVPELIGDCGVGAVLKRSGGSSPQPLVRQLMPHQERSR